MKITKIACSITKSYYNCNKDLKVISTNAYTELINKIALSSIDDKRLQTFDNTRFYLHGTNAFKVCEIEMVFMIDYYKHDNEDEIMFGIC